jgi:hypothetical protein
MSQPDDLDPQLVALIVRRRYFDADDEAQQQRLVEHHVRHHIGSAAEAYLLLAELKAEGQAEIRALKVELENVRTQRNRAGLDARRALLGPLAAAAKREKAIRAVTTALLEYIDAIPSDVADALPGMPGVDRDWVAEVLALPADTSALEAALAEARQEERQRCREAVAAEHLHEPNPESEGDAVYDRAIEDALAAIDALPESEGEA